MSVLDHLVIGWGADVFDLVGVYVGVLMFLYVERHSAVWAMACGLYFGYKYSSHFCVNGPFKKSDGCE